MSLDERVSRELKLSVAKDIVSSYVRGVGASGNTLTAEQIAEMLKTIYVSVEALVPDPEKRRVGLGV